MATQMNEEAPQNPLATIPFAENAAFAPLPPMQAQPANVSDYLRQQRKGFADIPFNAVDSLILSSLSYLNFEHYPLSNLQDRVPVPIIDVLRFTDMELLRAGSWLKSGADVEEFINALVHSIRYKDLCVCLYRNENSENTDKQFAAVTFTADDMLPYVAYRGTDGSIKGWKEDFDLAYRELIPSHLSAHAYLSGVLSCFKGPLTIGGHSKGGNLAEYAGSVVDGRQFGRIAKIYNHDGPSFLQNPSPRYDTKAYKDKRIKLVPESSIFGMILEDEDDFRIIRSTGTSIFQHRPLTWVVDGTDFEYLDSLSAPASIFDATLDNWLKSCTPEQREAFLSTIFNLLVTTDAKRWKELQRKLPSNLGKIYRSSKDIDDETREAIKQTLAHLATVVKEQRGSVFSELKERVFWKSTDE